MANPFPAWIYPEEIICRKFEEKPCHGYGCFSAFNVSISDVDIAANANPLSEHKFTFQRNHGQTSGIDFRALDPSIPLSTPEDVELDRLSVTDCYKKVKIVQNGKLKWRYVNRAPDDVGYLCENHPEIMFGSSFQLIEDEMTAHLLQRRKVKRGRPRSQSSYEQVIKNLRLHRIVSDAIFDIPQDLLLKYLHEEIHTTFLRTVYDAGYSGGCLQYIPGDSDNGILVYPSGVLMDTLNLRLVTGDYSTQQPILELGQLQQYEIKEKIYQIDSVKYAETSYIGVRTSKHCHLLEVQEESDSSAQFHQNVKDTLQFNSPLTSISLSPYIAGECAISTDSGAIKLWTAGQRLQEVYDAESSLFFPCEDRWRHTHFGSHPRLLMIADRTGMKMVDFRDKSKCHESPLFSLPSVHLGKNQFVMATKQHPSNHFHHFIATQSSLLLLDERFPQKPVLTWSHMLDSPPLCMDIVSDITPTEGIVLLSSHTSCQTHCIQYSSKSMSPAEAIGTPWRVALPNSGYLSLNEDLEEHMESVVEKRLQQPLIGLCNINHRNDTVPAFSVLQMTSVGDIFYQSYASSQNTSGRHCDKTACSGPGLQAKTLEQMNEQRCRAWLKSVVQMYREKTEEVCHPNLAKIQRLDVGRQLAEMSLLRRSHSACRLCNTDGSKDSDTYDDSTDTCHMCGWPVSESRKLLQCYKDRVSVNGTVFKLTNVNNEEEDLQHVTNLVKPEESEDRMSQLMWNTWQYGYDQLDNVPNMEELTSSESTVTPTRKSKGSPRPGGKSPTPSETSRGTPEPVLRPGTPTRKAKSLPVTAMQTPTVSRTLSNLPVHPLSSPMPPTPHLLRTPTNDSLMVPCDSLVSDSTTENARSTESLSRETPTAHSIPTIATTAYDVHDKTAHSMPDNAPTAHATPGTTLDETPTTHQDEVPPKETYINKNPTADSVRKIFTPKRAKKRKSVMGF